MKTQWSYDRVSNFYQKLANMYSFGMIRESKRIQVKYMKPGKKALYVGCGSAEDAVMAAEKGINVTCIDISEKMINNAKKAFEKRGAKGKFINKSILELEAYEVYDYVCLNYFLNNFSDDAVLQFLVHVSKLVKQDGKILIADFYTHSKNPLVKKLQLFNFGVAVRFFALFKVAPVHKLPNYFSLLHKVGFKTEIVSTCRFCKIGLPLYCSIVSTKAKNRERKK